MFTLVSEALERWEAFIQHSFSFSLSLSLPDSGQVITPHVKNLKFLLSLKASLNACQVHVWDLKNQTRTLQATPKRAGDLKIACQYNRWVTKTHSLIPHHLGAGRRLNVITKQEHPWPGKLRQLDSFVKTYHADNQYVQGEGRSTSGRLYLLRFC